MLIDRVRIRVTGGGGGNGCCSFRREKYVPHGGPEGGDGGDGGAVYLRAEKQLNSLLDVRYHSHWKGNRGDHGRGSAEHGKGGKDIFVDVPPGTLVRDMETNEILCDLSEPGMTFLAGAAGKGGRGNARFATATNRVPKFAELGEPGVEKEYLLELKLIAEVGLVGLPNAGKSTFLSQVTAARPKIADYPFTTLSPNLGVVELSGFRQLTVADIPGIIEGAADGKGLGHDFLRHIERTKVLLFLIDTGDPEPVKTLEVLEAELAAHSDVFVTRPRVFALNKADLPDNQERFEEMASQFTSQPHFISAATGAGIPAVLEELWTLVERVRKEEESGMVVEENERTYQFEAPFDVTREGAGFRCEGRKVERAVRMTDFDNEEAVRHLQRRLKNIGLFRALKRLGAEEGQSIMIGDIELEYHPE